MLILALDPSINHMGWTLFTTTTEEDIWRIFRWGTLETLKFKSYSMADRIIYTIEELGSTLRGFIVHPFILQAVVIEEPQLWGAYKSVASQHSGALLSLYMLTGALCWWGWRYVSKEVVSVKVSQWKGQLPKRITTKRTQEFWKVRFETSDEADAAGLGTWYLKSKGFRHGTERTRT